MRIESIESFEMPAGEDAHEVVKNRLLSLALASSPEEGVALGALGTVTFLLFLQVLREMTSGTKHTAGRSRSTTTTRFSMCGNSHQIYCIFQPYLSFSCSFIPPLPGGTSVTANKQFPIFSGPPFIIFSTIFIFRTCRREIKEREASRQRGVGVLEI
jgi:hypothetical protein